MASINNAEVPRAEVPGDIMVALNGAFISNSVAEMEDLSRILWFLTDGITTPGYLEPFVSTLRSVIQNVRLFKKTAQQLAEDSRQALKDPRYKKCMYDIWFGELAYNPDYSIQGRNHCGEIYLRSSKIYFSANILAALHRVGTEVGKAVGGSSLALVAAAPRTIMNVTLLIPYLILDILNLIKKWWRGEVTGGDCVKTIVGFGVVTAAGLTGGVVGAVVGAIGGAAKAGISDGPYAMIEGAISGGIVGAYRRMVNAEQLMAKLLGWNFGMADPEALSSAYAFMGVSEDALNSEINSRYRHLALQYHPDRGGRPDQWTQLQYSLAVIRAARGEV